MCSFGLTHPSRRSRRRSCVGEFVRPAEKLGGFRIGITPDGGLAGRDQIADRLVVLLRLKEMARQQCADVFGAWLPFDPRSDRFVKLPAFGEGHRVVDDVSQDFVAEDEFVGRAVRGVDDAQADQGGERSLDLGGRRAPARRLSTAPDRSFGRRRSPRSERRRPRERVRRGGGGSRPRSSPAIPGVRDMSSNSPFAAVTEERA